MKIVVLCPYPMDRAPSQRLKFEQYYDSWRSAGFEVDVRPFWSEEAWDVLYQEGRGPSKVAALLRGLARRVRDLRAARSADVVYLHLEAIPLGPPWLERRIVRAHVPMVYDLDDLVHLPHSSEANRFMRWLRNPEKVPELLHRAREVVVCTEYLRDYAERFAPPARITNISSTIDTDVYRPRPHRDSTEGVVVGWSGSHSTSPYLHRLDDVFRELVRTDEIRLKVIGDASFRLPGVEVDARDWRLETEVEDLSEIDIGVYPLPHEEWVLGKSGLKALQYMALGIPTVAERVGTNPEIIDDGWNGFLAEGPEEWLERLRGLIRNPDLRAAVGRRGRGTVVERYSVRANEERYLRVLRRAVQGPGAEDRSPTSGPGGGPEAGTSVTEPGD